MLKKHPSLIHPRFSSFVSSLSNGSSSSHQFSFSSGSSGSAPSLATSSSSTSSTPDNEPTSARGLLVDSSPTKSPIAPASSSSSSSLSKEARSRFAVSLRNAIISFILLAPWLILVFIFFGAYRNLDWVVPTAASFCFLWALMLGWYLYWRVSPIETSIICLSQHHNHHYCNNANVTASTPDKNSVRFARSTVTEETNTTKLSNYNNKNIPVSYRKVDLMFRILSRPRSRSADDVLWHRHALALHNAFGVDEYGTVSDNVVTSKSRRFKSKFDKSSRDNDEMENLHNDDDDETGQTSSYYPPRSSIFSPHPPTSPSASSFSAQGVGGGAGGSLFRKSTLELLTRPMAVSHRKPATHFIDGKAHSRMESLTVEDAIHVSSTSGESSISGGSSLIGSWESGGNQHTRSVSLNLPQRDRAAAGKIGFGAASSHLRIPLFNSRSISNNFVRHPSTTSTGSGMGGLIHEGGIGSLHPLAATTTTKNTTTPLSSSSSSSSHLSASMTPMIGRRPPSIEVLVDGHKGLDFHGILESPCSNHSPGILVHELTTDTDLSRLGDESIG